VPFLVIICSRSRLPRYLLPVYPGAAILVAWWADRHGATRTILGRVLGWAPLVGVAGALVAVPWLPPLDETGLTLDASTIGQLVPLVILAAAIGVVFVTGLTRARPSLLVYGGVVLTALAFGYGVWLFNEVTDRRDDFKSMAAILSRHAAGSDLVVFTQAK